MLTAHSREVQQVPTMFSHQHGLLKGNASVRWCAGALIAVLERQQMCTECEAVLKWKPGPVPCPRHKLRLPYMYQ
eukprot:6179856-Pleurochrysis_carterae.AAC.2